MSNYRYQLLKEDSTELILSELKNLKAHYPS
jgi:hypothetical protein